MSSQSSRRRIEAVDHISNLPDSIILHILSFVPTKSAVKTSILSKRWRYMWTKVPVLDFTEMPRSNKFYLRLNLQQRIHFKNFVDRVLLHNDVSYVQRLCLQLTQGVDDFYFKSWLSALTRREFREIMLEFWHKQLEPIVLPTSFLSSKKLVILKLNGRFSVNVPLTLHLPNIEIIHLTRLQLPSDDFLKRLSSCHVLKELCISDCDGITRKLYVELLSLMRLEIWGTMEKCKSPQPCIVIKAPNLRYLSLDDDPTQYDICDLCLLVEAYLNICFDDDDDTHTLQLLRKVSGVKTLRFGTNGCFGCLSKPPIFENLTCLTLESNHNTYELVECAPKLKSLTFEQVLDGEHSLEARSVPKCLSCLDRVEFDCFEGEEEELGFVAYFLKAASVLKEVKINMLPSRICNKSVYEKLLMLPRSSSACRVEVKSS